MFHRSLFSQPFRVLSLGLRVAFSIPSRTKVTFSLQNLAKTSEYLSLPPSQRAKWVPAPRDGITDVQSLLSTIDRSTSEYASKFKSWDHLFQASSEEMADMGIKTRHRKYIISCREWFKRGADARAVKIKVRPKRKPPVIVRRKATKERA